MTCMVAVARKFLRFVFTWYFGSLRLSRAAAAWSLHTNGSYLKAGHREGRKAGCRVGLSTSTAPLYPPLYRDICGAGCGGVLANPGPWRDIKPFAPPIKQCSVIVGLPSIIDVAETGAEL